MPSPFTGMDPYLERPGQWRGVHTRLITILGELLSDQVAPAYFVDSEDDVYILAPDDPARAQVRPDIYVVEAAAMAAAGPVRGKIARPALIDLPETLEVHYPYLEVRDTRDREVVATIELLSPINKTAGSAGQRDFLRKRERIMRSAAHWIEIDLLRAGARPLAAGGAVAYYAALHRVEQPDKLAVWFASLRRPLPTIAVPLRPPHPDVPLDLQAAVDTLYRRFRYDVAIDYSVPPHPPLSGADAAWAEERIAAWRAP